MTEESMIYYEIIRSLKSKRSQSLNRAAIKTATGIAKLDSKGARWIAADVLRELNSAAVQRRLRRH